MTIEETPETLRSALRQLRHEAMQRAASVETGSNEHDFYVGVLTAAEDRMHPERRDTHDLAWLDRQVHSFRDGYLKTSDLIGASIGHIPFRFHLPTGEGSEEGVRK